jgi:signal transduction histidine kinase/ligand-binding sensor domain-containing protein
VDSRPNRHPGAASDGQTRRSSHRAGLRLAFLALALAASGPRNAAAQRPQVTRLTVGDGLPSSTVTALAQDASGRLLLINRGRAVVYDGRSFESAPQGNNVRAGPLAALAAGASGEVWAVAQSDPQVYRWSSGSWETLPRLPLPDGREWSATALAVTAAGEPVVGTRSEGLFVRDGSGWSQLGTAAGLPTSEVTALARYADGVAIGTPAGLCRLASGRVDCGWREGDPRLAEPVVALADVSDANGAALAVVTPRGLSVVGREGLRIRAEVALDIAPAYVPAVVGMDRGGRLYFGTPRALFVLGPGETRPQPLGQLHGLVGDGAMAFLSDREGGFWIAGFRGLSRIGSWRFLSYDTREGLGEDEVSAIAEPAPGRIVAGHNGTLSFLGPGSTTTFRFAEPRALRPDRVLGFAVDARGTTWGAAQEGGLLEIRPDRRVVVHKPLPAVRAVAIDARGRLWAAGWRELAVRVGSRFEPAGPRIDGPPHQLPLRTLSVGRGGRLYVGALGGLIWRDGLDAEHLDTRRGWQRANAASYDGSDVYAILDDGAGPVWVGTGAGLHVLEGQDLVPAQGAFQLSRPVYFLRRDRAGRLWAGTDDGVFVSSASGFRQLTSRHGLAGRETNRGASLVDHRGDVWIGTDQGLSVYRERYDLGPAASPPVEIRSLEAGGEQLQPGAPVELPPHLRALIVHAVPVALSSEEEVLCRYRLEGFDEDWQGPAPLTTAGVRYTNLPPGRYRFRIAAGWHAGGPWGPEAVTQEIRLTRPLVERPAFQLGVLLALGLAVGGAYRWRMVRIARRNAELKRLNDRLAEALATRERLVEELGGRNVELERFAYTVSHDLKAPLITIRSFAGFLEKDVAAGDLERFHLDAERIRAAAGRMLRQLEDLLNLARAGRALGPRSRVAMSEIAREAAENLPALSRAELVIPRELPCVSVDRARVVEVLQNLLGNAIKFMGDEPRPRIEVGARASAADTVFFVADNGIGIEPRHHESVFGLFERLDPRLEGSGVGLAVARRVVELHGGRIWVESEGRGRGSRFCFTLPTEALPA